MDEDADFADLGLERRGVSTLRDASESAVSLGVSSALSSPW